MEAHDEELAATGESSGATVRFVLRLYVTGATPNSVRALLNIKAICEELLHDRYELEIVDVYQQPALAKQEQLIALPMLVKKLPLPETRMIGDLSNKPKVLRSLGLK